SIRRSRAQLQSTLLMVVLAISCLVSTSLIDRLSRRMMLLSCSTLSTLALLVFSLAAHFHSPDIATAAVFAVMITNGVGIGPVAWCIFPELVPLSHRSTMLSLCFLARSVLVVATNFATLPLFEWMGGLCFIPVFVIPCAVCIGILYVYLPETSGRETNDIVNDLRGNN
ncbi:hypothetical protein PMAYCL1PPCAC_21485, partial [Pristionchus mayeri]